ncbi:MAG: dockerin type I repeat-containing protein, partial [Candidatus Aminicenantes bacterium]|nr:dockerin type I repeat-containing protein [Candidatus Aminicenantes bacterium]
VTAAADALWAPMSNFPWITITSGFTGSGNGTVAFAVAANTAADQRTGTISIGDKTFTVTQPGTSTVLKGDINGDGNVNLADAILALQVNAGMAPSGIRSGYAASGADVNGNGKVGEAEAIYILQYVAGLRQ